MRRPIDRRELQKAVESLANWHSFLEDCDYSLAEADFSDLFIEGLDFTGVDLESCNFSRSQIESCNFVRSNIYGSNFTGTQIGDCDFKGSLLTNSRLTSCEVFNCSFALAELSGVLTSDATFGTCDFSRARGLDQSFLDNAVGDLDTLIPVSLDYPEHWLLSTEELSEQDLLQKLRAFRGDEALLCSFDGNKLIPEVVAQRDRPEVASALSFIQDKVRYLVEERFLHNESPQLFRAISDYYLAMTSNAGEKGRWPLKSFEIDQIRFALEGMSVSAYLEASREEINKCAPEKLHVIDQIVASHHVLLSNLDSWRRYVGAVVDARLDQNRINEMSSMAKNLVKEMKVSPHFDEEIPRTFQLLQKLMEKPLSVARMAALGLFRAIESAISAIFSFARRFVVASADEAVDFGSKLAIRAILTVLVGGGAVSALSMFPHVAVWVQGGLKVLRSLGILP